MAADVPGIPIFSRILCGVDETPESLVAVRQASRLRDQDGVLSIRAVAHTAKAVHAGFAATHAAERLWQEAEASLAAASALAPEAKGQVVNGDPATVLLREAESDDATLIAVGSHGRTRMEGMLLGTVAARVLHEARCSVLIARAPRNDPGSWPGSIAVGVDGSVESAAAFSVAQSAAERFGAPVRALASAKDQLDSEAAHAIAPGLEEQTGSAAEVLTGGAEPADLVVVGSRGLKGVRSLGSVSERVAYQARVSVLVVRPPR